MSKKKAPVLQSALFSLDNPPVKQAPPTPERLLPTIESEAQFYEVLHEREPGSPKACTKCGKEYLSISYHLLRDCPDEKISPLPQVDAPIIEPRESSDNMPGAYAWEKKKGGDKAEVMHPSYRPPQKQTATAATTQPTKPAPPNKTHIDLPSAGTSAVSTNEALNESPKEKASEGSARL